MRHEGESNPRIAVLQTAVFPLHHRADFVILPFFLNKKKPPFEGGFFNHLLSFALTVIFFGLAASVLGIVTVTMPFLTSALALCQSPPERAVV